jgi:hypothetical protein
LDFASKSSQFCPNSANLAIRQGFNSEFGPNGRKFHIHKWFKPIQMAMPLKEQGMLRGFSVPFCNGQLWPWRSFRDSNADPGFLEDSWDEMARHPAS